MTRFFFIICLILGASSICLAQQKKKPAKPQVIVYGHHLDAFAAAVQSAQSGAETLWIMDSTDVGGALTHGQSKQINSNTNLDVGSWALLLKGLTGVEELSDSAITAAKRNVAPRIVMNVLEAVSDTVKRLTVKKKLSITEVEQSGKGWQVTLSNKEKIKVSAVVDASKTAPLERPSTDTAIIYQSPLFRTGIAIGQLGNQVFNIPFTRILPDSANRNYFYTRIPLPTTNEPLAEEQTVPLRMLIGQACGAAAAYCAFFKTSSNDVRVRTLQGELIAYNAALIPFQDVHLSDIHHAQIQRVGATGMLEGRILWVNDQKRFLFQPDSAVSSMEIEPIMKQLYTRSQIWFKDKQIQKLTLKDLLSLIKYIANRGNELDAEIEKGWSKRFQFKGTYQPDAPLTRRTFSVLVDTYLQPFNVRVKQDGHFQY